ncbi:MAG TPA: hypothetical protein PK939_08785, partial [Bacteroidales bacterium]|nr:hypothetical protein [Bacteroidales bacterium]
MKLSRFKILLPLVLIFGLNTIVAAQNNSKADPKETSQKFAAALFYIENFYVDTTQPAKLV